MNQTLTIGLAALLAGGVGGFLVGKTGGGGEADVAENSEALERIREANQNGGGSRSVRVDSIKEALREPGQLARMQSLMDMYASMDVSQLEEAAKDLDSLPMADRIMASMLLFSRWGELDPYGALEYSKTMGFGGMFARPTILRGWAGSDPVNAAKYFEENPSDFQRMGGPGRGRGDSGAGVIAAEWAKQDPEAALAWAKGLDGRDQTSAMVSVLGEMAIEDPQKAAGVAATMDEDDRGRAYSEIAETWASTDLEAAEAWISTLSGEDKNDAMAAAIGVIANSDPQAAASKFSEMTEGRERERAARDIASAWAREDPAGAANWVLEAEGGEDAMERAVGTWTSQDPVSALAFVEEQPAGEVRDAAAQSYLWNNRDGVPQDSMALAETITDDRDRARAMGMTARRWMETDESSARSYVEQSSALSDEMKERVLDGGGDRGGRRGR